MHYNLITGEGNLTFETSLIEFQIGKGPKSRDPVHEPLLVSVKSQSSMFGVPLLQIVTLSSLDSKMPPPPTQSLSYGNIPLN